MDDYTEPKDTKKFQWGDLTSPLSTNLYSDDEDDDDGYSQPYQHVPGPKGTTCKNSVSSEQQIKDIYEIAPEPDEVTTYPDYDVPPSAVDDYNRLTLNGSSQTKPTSRRSLPSDSQYCDSDEDSYNHTASWTAQRTERQNSNASSTPSTPDKSVPDIPSQTKSSSRQNSSDQMFGTSPVLRNPVVGKPQDSPRSITRQRVIYPKKRSSYGVTADANGDSGSKPGPALYEEAWDTAQQQKKLERDLIFARSISTCSDTFEDALEYLPDDWAPTRPKSELRKGNSKDEVGGKVKEVTGGDYEPAWDLNRGLEEKLRSLNVMRSNSNPGEVKDKDVYQQPWDSAQQQRHLEEIMQQAKTGGGSPARRSPQRQQSGPNTYEDAWDIRKGVVHRLQWMVSQHIVNPFALHPINWALHRRVIPSQYLNASTRFLFIGGVLKWYHGNISRDDAERMLSVCKDGSYLVRDSSDRFHYTLSIKSSRLTIHIQIDQCQKSDGRMRYILGKNSSAFPTIPSMIDHYTQHSVPIKGADHMTLLHPVRCKYSGGDESTI